MGNVFKIKGKVKIIQLLARLIIPVGILYIICILNQENLAYIDTLVRPLIMPKTYILGIINGISFIIMAILTIIGIITFVKLLKYDKLAGKLVLINIIYNLFLCYTNFCIWMYNEM